MKSRIRNVLAAGVAVVALAGTAADPAAAHYTDRDHQHGWTELGLVSAGPVFRCMPGLGIGAGSVSVAIPDFMTTPGGTRYVYFRVILERYNGSTWVAATWNGSQWVYLGVTPWYYTVANSSGPVWGWRELGTNRYAPASRIGFYPQPGFYYRATVQFYWGYDQQQHNEVTSFCQL